MHSLARFDSNLIGSNLVPDLSMTKCDLCVTLCLLCLRVSRDAGDLEKLKVLTNSS